MNVQESINLLGLEVEDKVTGFKGVVVTMSFDLYGCVQAVIKPKADKDNKVSDGQWYDVNRLKVNSKKPVMDVPDFVKSPDKQIKDKGPASKPIPN